MCVGAKIVVDRNEVGAVVEQTARSTCGLSGTISQDGRFIDANNDGLVERETLK